MTTISDTLPSVYSAGRTGVDNISTMTILTEEQKKELTTFIVAIVTVTFDYFMSNPIGAFTAVFGLLYVFEKWRTQRIDTKIKNHTLEDLEDAD